MDGVDAAPLEPIIAVHDKGGEKERSTDRGEKGGTLALQTCAGSNNRWFGSTRRGCAGLRGGDHR